MSTWPPYRTDRNLKSYIPECQLNGGAGIGRLYMEEARRDILVACDLQQ